MDLRIMSRIRSIPMIRPMPATGRPTDCENMQFGFLSVVDVPYPEMIEVSRNMSKELYSLRTQK